MRIEKVVTSGVFSLDGEDFDVDNNVWLVEVSDPDGAASGGTPGSVIVIDAAHDAGRIVEALRGRDVSAIVCTHGHNDHINAAGELSDRTGAPILLHAADRMLWDVVYADRPPTAELTDGARIGPLEVLHTPGHSPGAVSLLLAEANVVFTGDTLFSGGPGATGRSYSDFPTILASISSRLLTLPPGTTVHTGHGDSTTIGAEAPSLEEWRARGH